MACPVKLYNMNSTIFSLKCRHLRFLLSQSRHFCSKDNDATTKVSSSSKEKPDEEAKGTRVIRKYLRFKSGPVSDEVKEAAKQKLKSLLLNIKITSEKRSSPTSNLKLAKPLKRITKKERLSQMEAEKITPEKEMDMAVNAVASSFKEDPDKVKLELSEKLTSLNLTKGGVNEEIKDSEDLSQMNINQNLMSSVEEVAETLIENPIPPRSELTKRLMKLSLGEKVASDEKKSMRSVIEGMAFEKKSPVTQPETFSPRIQRTGDSDEIRDTVRKMKPRKRPPSERKIEHVNLFNPAPMNMFTPGFEIKPDSTNTLWLKLQEREVRLLTQFAPANAFEEMIMWTEQGKHWTFPIDNEIEMGEEEKVGFHEHVFLERHLKGFPTKGPIRHFMELVCVGLSKNPYVSVERKVENIEWFRSYFKDKEELLKEVGALD